MNRHDKSEQKERDNHNCSSYGCPLGGALNISGAGYYCRFHYKADFKQFTEITLRIKKAEPMLQRCNELQKDPFNRHLYEYLRKPEFNKLEDENAWQYRDRLQNYLKSYILDGVEMTMRAQEEHTLEAGKLAEKLDLGNV